MNTVPAKPKSNNKLAKTTRYRTCQWPGHPLAQSDGKVYVHRAVLYEKLGPGEHKCHWCKRNVSWDGKGIRRIVADHLDNDEWNNDPDNLVPSCRKCNSDRAADANFLTHCKKGHEFTEANTYKRPDGKGRFCRACAREREKRREPRRKRAKTETDLK